MATMKTWKQCPKSPNNWSLNLIGITCQNPDKKVDKKWAVRATITIKAVILCTNRGQMIALFKNLHSTEKMTANLLWPASPVLNQSRVEKNKFLEWTHSKNLQKESFCTFSKMMTTFFITWIWKNPKNFRRSMWTFPLRFLTSTNR